MKALKVFSFDVFDTILCRKFAFPTDLFIALGQWANENKIINENAQNFQKNRQLIESDTRLKYKNGELKILDIYLNLKHYYGWNDEQMELILKKEYELELLNIVGNPEIIKLIKLKRKLKDSQIAFLSDMYLPSELIKEMLIKVGIYEDLDILIVSNEYSENKAYGGLFKILMGKLNVPEDCIKHMGDNYVSDYKIPLALGINATYYSNSKLTIYEKIIREFRGFNELDASRIAGELRIARLNFVNQERNKKTIWDTSLNVVGPLLYGFVNWCLEEAQRLKLNRLYFLARDGEILQEIAKKIIEAKNISIECNYLYGSRRAWHIPSITEIGEDELLWIFEQTYFLSIESVLKRVELEITPEIKGQLNKIGLGNKKIDENLTKEELCILKKLFKTQTIQDSIFANAKEKREILLKYLDQERLFIDNEYAIVDIGWRGRLQKSLTKILKVDNRLPRGGIKGLYFGLINEPNQGLYKSYFIDTKEKKSNLKIINYDLIECFVAATHGSTIGYKNDVNKIVPILTEEVNERAKKWGIDYQRKGIIQATDIFLSNIGKTNYSSNDYINLSYEILEQFFKDPSLNESVTYGDFLFAEDQIESNFYKLAPSFDSLSAIKYRFSKKYIKHGYWLQASFKRTSKLNKFIMFLSKELILSKVKIYTKKIKIF